MEQLQTLGNRLTQLQAHDALCLLQNALAIPKVLYILRTAPSFRSTVLSSFDCVLRTLLETYATPILAIRAGFMQASLPIHLGGLGIRSVTMLAPSAFLASAAGTSHIVQALLPPMTLLTTRPQEEEALRLWKSCSGSVDPPTGNATGTQKEAGAWLTAPPLSALGLRMDNDSIRVAVGLRLGSALCIPHDCALCGAQVDETGVHILSCRKNKGRLPRHSYLNDIIKRALTAIDIPCALEPRGLCRGDGRRLDGISILPWEQGRCLVWDATCHDTFAPTNIPFSSKGAGVVANCAAASKRLLYSDLCQSYTFIPIAVESAGSIGKDALDFLHDLGRRTRSKT